MANTNESDAPAADTTPPAAASIPVATRSSRTGLGIAGIAVGSVLAAALLFGGGLAVGLALPSGETGPHVAAGQNDPRPGDRDGQRPGDRDGARPGDRDRARPGDRDGQRPPIHGDHPLPGQNDPDDGSAEN